MSSAAIRSAFESVLKTWADAQLPPVAIAQQNIAFEQPSRRYLRAFVLPAETESLDIGRANRRFNGVFQVSIVEPVGAGPDAAEAVCDAISALYPLNAPIVSGGMQIWVTRPLSAAPAIPERDRFVIPASLAYRADTY
jgi:hypothetical protein